MKSKTIQVTDQEDFVAAYVKYQNVVMKVAYDFLHDYHMAQDVCQEAFLRLGFYFDYIPRKKRKPWLIVVAGNCAKDILKKGGKYNMTVGLPEVEEADAQAEDVIEKHLNEITTQKLVVSVLNRLREKKVLWYEVLVLVECLDVPRKRVAEEYGISVPALEGYLRRAKDWIIANCGEEYRNL